MNAIQNDLRSQRRARRIAVLGRAAFLVALLLSVVAGAGWRHPSSPDEVATTERAAILANAGR